VFGLIGLGKKSASAVALVCKSEPAWVLALEKKTDLRTTNACALH
jgi:hypothetical protein